MEGKSWWWPEDCRYTSSCGGPRMPHSKSECGAQVHTSQQLATLPPQVAPAAG